MRAAIVVALVVAGCGGGAASPTDAMSATFSNLAGANTSGVAISTSFASCFLVNALVFTCGASEHADGAGRTVTVTFDGVPVAGMDYPIGGAQNATVLFQDPTDFGTASGLRQWQSVPGTGAIHVVDWSGDGMHVSFSYYASVRPLASPAAGTFDIVGDGNIVHIGTR